MSWLAFLAMEAIMFTIFTWRRDAAISETLMMLAANQEAVLAQREARAKRESRNGSS